MQDVVYWSLIHKIWGIKGNKILQNIMGKISGYDFWGISPKDLKMNFPAIPQEMAEHFLSERRRVNIEQEKLRLAKSKIEIISIYDSKYPKRLKTIYSPPPLIYLRGKIIESNLKIAIVGSRKASPYGKKSAHKLAENLSNHGIQIISGLARGIDTSSHQGALEGQGGTIGVLGCGVDIVYPRENMKLYKQIITSENSGILSEFPVSTVPQKFYFPMRNRIISGLSDGVVVIEAGEQSGSLITAEFALEQGKDVFAVPGPIDNSLYKGSHRLIKDGAKLIDNIDDILEEYGQLSLFKEKKLNVSTLGSIEKEILSLLTSDPISLDEIIKEVEYSPQEVLTALSMLEIKSYIKGLAGRKYISLNWGD